MKRTLKWAALAVLAVGAMAMISEGNVGVYIANDGSSVRSRYGRESQLITGNLAGDFYESASRGQLFTISTAAGGTTQVAANQTPLAANTGQPIVGVYNPVGSTVNVEIVSVTINQISGTPTAGGFVYNVVANQNITAAGTAPQANYGNKKSAVVGLVNQAIASSGGAAMSLLRPVPGCTSFAGALAATTMGLSCFDVINGTIVIPPGGAFGVATVGAAGTAWQISAAIVEREAPIPQ